MLQVCTNSPFFSGTTGDVHLPCHWHGDTYRRNLQCRWQNCKGCWQGFRNRRKKTNLWIFVFWFGFYLFVVFSIWTLISGSVRHHKWKDVVVNTLHWLQDQVIEKKRNFCYFYDFFFQLTFAVSQAFDHCISFLALGQRTQNKRQHRSHTSVGLLMYALS